LLTDRDDNRTSYNTDNKPVSTTRADDTRLAVTYWADGSRKTLTTSGGPDGQADGQAEQTTTFHYTPGG
uniref:hypothetical protein n=1 Tax=Kitasatospora sp. MBT63 TaxID=1444768 RepID=UPI00053B6414